MLTAPYYFKSTTQEGSEPFAKFYTLLLFSTGY